MSLLSGFFFRSCVNRISAFQRPLPLLIVYAADLYFHGESDLSDLIGISVSKAFPHIFLSLSSIMARILRRPSLTLSLSSSFRIASGARPFSIISRHLLTVTAELLLLFLFPYAVPPSFSASSSLRNVMSQGSYSYFSSSSSI